MASFSTSVPLVPGVKVVISQISVVQTPPGSISLTGNGNASDPESDWFGNFLGQTGDWDQGEGKLTLLVTRATSPGQELSFSFILVNGLQGQASPGIRIETEGFRITPLTMDKPTNNLAPLLIGGFRTKSISQSTSCPGRVNTITITLSFYVPIPWEMDVPGVDPNERPAVAFSGLTGLFFFCLVRKGTLGCRWGHRKRLRVPRGRSKKFVFPHVFFVVKKSKNKW